MQTRKSRSASIALSRFMILARQHTEALGVSCSCSFTGIHFWRCSVSPLKDSLCRRTAISKKDSARLILFFFFSGRSCLVHLGRLYCTWEHVASCFSSQMVCHMTLYCEQPSITFGQASLRSLLSRCYALAPFDMMCCWRQGNANTVLSIAYKLCDFLRKSNYHSLVTTKKKCGHKTSSVYQICTICSLYCWVNISCFIFSYWRFICLFQLEGKNVNMA